MSYTSPLTSSTFVAPYSVRVTVPFLARVPFVTHPYIHTTKDQILGHIYEKNIHFFNLSKSK